MRVDRVLNRRKVAKHFTIDIADDSFSYARDQDSITAEASSTASTCCAPASRPGDLDSPRGRLLLQGPGPGRAGLPRLQHRPGHPARSGTAPRTGSARTCSCGCSRTTSAGTCRPGSRPSCSPTTTSPPPRPPGPARSPPPPAPRAPWPRPPPSSTPADLPGAQLRQPARRPGHHLPEHHRPRRPRPARLPARHHPHRRSSGTPSTCSASATASAPRSQQPGPAHHESPGKRPTARIAGGTSA